MPFFKGNENKKNPDYWVNESKRLLNMGFETSLNAIFGAKDKKVINCYEESIKCCDKAIELNPRSKLAWRNRFLAFRDLRRNEEAIKCLDKITEINPEDCEAWKEKGFYLQEFFGPSEDAVKCFEKALEICQEPYSWYKMGVLFKNLGNSEEALKCFNKTLKLKPQYSDALTLKGEIAETLGRFDEAVESYGNVSWEAKAKFYCRIGQFLEAAKLYNSCGHQEEAKKCYERILESNPQNPSVWFDTGIILKNEHKYQEALMFFAKTVEASTQNIDAWEEKVGCLKMLNRFEEALRCYQQALEINPNNNQLQKNQQYKINELAIHALLKGQNEIILKMLEQEWNVDSQLKDGNTALHAASFKGHANVVARLIKKGADVNIKMHEHSDEPGATPLHLAAIKGNIDSIQLLLDAGADLKAELGGAGRSLTSGATALHLAAYHGQIEAADLLVRRGADLEATACGKTPLIYAINKQLHGMICRLISLGANVNAKCDGRTVLSFALSPDTTSSIPMTNQERLAYDENKNAIIKCLQCAGAHC